VSDERGAQSGQASSAPQPRPVNVQAELAKERNRAAAERTLMAWIRTALSLISFGFGIDSIVRVIQRSQSNINPVGFSAIVGLAFIALGTYAIIVAAFEHHKELGYIQRSEDYVYRTRRSLALIVAIGLVCIGVAAFVSILFNGTS
jgi:putative membrane protein